MNQTLIESLQQHIAASGITKRELARRAGVRPELLSRLAFQKGSDTRTLQKLADVLNLEIVLAPKTVPAPMSKAHRLGLSLPYDWSNPDIPDIALIRKALEYANLADLTRLALEFGIDRLEVEMQAMPPALTRSAAMVLPNIRFALGG
ncbi:MAG: helix-turn-helix domain-containing protein [Burkholderiales bacterium]